MENPTEKNASTVNTENYIDLLPPLYKENDPELPNSKVKSGRYGGIPGWFWKVGLIISILGLIAISVPSTLMFTRPADILAQTNKHSDKNNWTKITSKGQNISLPAYLERYQSTQNGYIKQRGNSAPKLRVTVEPITRTTVRPQLKLNITVQTKFIALLPDGKLVTVKKTIANRNQLIILNQDGGLHKLVSNQLICATAVLVNMNTFYVLTCQDFCYEYSHDGRKLSTNRVLQSGISVNNGPLSVYPPFVPKTFPLLLAQPVLGTVFVYNLSTRRKIVPKTRFQNPRSISYLILDNKDYYLICNSRDVSVYNSQFNTVLIINVRHGETLATPSSAILTPEGNIWIAETAKHRISEFSSKGDFKRDVLLRSDGIYAPLSMAYSEPYLWVQNSYSTLLQFKMF